MPLSRRTLLSGLLAAAGGLLLGTRPARALGPGSAMRLARLLPAGALPARAGAERRLVWEVLKRTSIAGELEDLPVTG